jgi:hypothetical protein
MNSEEKTSHSTIKVKIQDSRFQIQDSRTGITNDLKCKWKSGIKMEEFEESDPTDIDVDTHSIFHNSARNSELIFISSSVFPMSLRSYPMILFQNKVNGNEIIITLHYNIQIFYNQKLIRTNLRYT